jgi:hypothetical protein
VRALALLGLLTGCAQFAERPTPLALTLDGWWIDVRDTINPGDVGKALRFSHDAVTTVGPNGHVTRRAADLRARPQESWAVTFDDGELTLRPAGSHLVGAHPRGTLDLRRANALETKRLDALTLTVRNHADFLNHLDEQVRLVGVYRQLDMRMRQTPPPEYHGQAAIELTGGWHIALETPTEPEGARTADEIARCEGKRVVVVGTLREALNNPEVATMLIQRIVDIKSVELAGEND